MFGVIYNKTCASDQAAITQDFNPSRLNWISLTPLLYGMPTSVVLVLVIYTIFNKKGRYGDFKGHFFPCFGVACGVDLVTWLSIFFVRELPTAPLADPLYRWMGDEGFHINLLDGIESYSIFVSFLSPIVLTLNRFNAIVFFMDKFRIWRKLSKFIYIIWFGLPLCVTWHIFIMYRMSEKCRLVNFNSTEAYHSFGNQKPSVFVSISTTIGIFIMSTGVINFVLNFIIIAVVIYWRIQDAHKPEELRRQVPEIKLFILTLLIAVNCILQTIHFFLNRAPELSGIRQTLYDIQPFLLDWYILSPVWISFMLFDNLRRNLLKILKKLVKKDTSFTSGVTLF